MKKHPVGAVGGKSPLLRYVDMQEQYGGHVIERMLSSIENGDNIVDLGAGYGRDLDIARSFFPDANLSGIEFDKNCCNALASKGVETFQIDLENEALPFSSNSQDIVIVNQVLEHLKDIFFVMHEVSRVLTVGGHAIIGVPNVASFHNRLMLMLGYHPTQSKSYSAHVRSFSYHDTKKLIDIGGAGALSVKSFGGAQFYPFPKMISRMTSRCFPQLAFSIFFLVRKDDAYKGSFFEYGRSLTASVFCQQQIDY